jgi:DNA-binding CsgD family transcriptional regulator/sugar-specific transcriptional regulator TrmB
MLEVFGVDRQVESVYLALLEHPAAGVRDIAHMLDIREDDVHDALDKLADLSLVGPQRDGQGTIHLISPDVALSYLVAREKARLLQRQHQVENSRAAIATLIAKLSAERAPAPATAALAQVFGLDAIRAKLAELAYNTERQVLSLMPDGPQTVENLEASKPLDEMLLGRDVEILTIYLDSVRNDPQNRGYVRWLVDLGGQVRTTAVLPLRLVVFDRCIAVVPINPGRSETGAAIVEGNGPVAAMCALFDQLWATSEPYPHAEAHSMGTDTPLSGQELAVVRLLAKGDTDTAIGRRLGVSVRTAGRLVSDIMARVDAKSRFQAGLRIGELGWHLSQPSQPASMPTESGQQLRLAVETFGYLGPREELLSSETDFTSCKKFHLMKSVREEYGTRSTLSPDTPLKTVPARGEAGACWMRAARVGASAVWAPIWPQV